MSSLFELNNLMLSSRISATQMQMNVKQEKSKNS